MKGIYKRDVENRLSAGSSDVVIPVTFCTNLDKVTKAKLHDIPSAAPPRLRGNIFVFVKPGSADMLEFKISCSMPGCVGGSDICSEVNSLQAIKNDSTVRVRSYLLGLLNKFKQRSQKSPDTCKHACMRDVLETFGYISFKDNAPRTEQDGVSNIIKFAGEDPCTMEDMGDISDNDDVDGGIILSQNSQSYYNNKIALEEKIKLNELKRRQIVTSTDGSLFQLKRPTFKTSDDVDAVVIKRHKSSSPTPSVSSILCGGEMEDTEGQNLLTDILENAPVNKNKIDIDVLLLSDEDFGIISKDDSDVEDETKMCSVVRAFHSFFTNRINKSIDTFVCAVIGSLVSEPMDDGLYLGCNDTTPIYVISLDRKELISRMNNYPSDDFPFKAKKSVMYKRAWEVANILDMWLKSIGKIGLTSHGDPKLPHQYGFRMEILAKVSMKEKYPFVDYLCQSSKRRNEGIKIKGISPDESRGKTTDEYLKFNKGRIAKQK